MAQLDSMTLSLKHRSKPPKSSSSLSALVQKLWLKADFLLNGDERSAFMYISHSNCSRRFNLFKGPDPCYPVVKCDGNCPSSSRDMAQNVILQGCDLERSTIGQQYSQTICILPICIQSFIEILSPLCNH